MRRFPNRGPFADPTLCVACGFGGASSHYCAPHSRRARCPNMGEQDGAHIHRMCGRCSFEWVESPLNEDV